MLYAYQPDLAESRLVIETGCYPDDDGDEYDEEEERRTKKTKKTKEKKTKKKENKTNTKKQKKKKHIFRSCITPFHHPLNMHFNLCSQVHDKL